ncbi:unnamed protein product [Dovyalis caffra]|uniref:NAC domain-containing protein n=1 Tax=Dovyalis caffra TaxID=77055 RepID=A0AAV1R187_9ROSI|nr:unnamed protein product [Dovyalis caffra]
MKITLSDCFQLRAKEENKAECSGQALNLPLQIQIEGVAYLSVSDQNKTMASSSRHCVGALHKELSNSTAGFSGIPIGFRFLPSDRDLVIHYLYKKIKGIPLPSDCTVTFCDLYGHQEPWEIWDTFGGSDNEDLLFFTNLKKISPIPSRNLKKMKQSAPRTHRQVGSSAGTWHDEGRNKRCEWLGIQWLVKIFTYENPKSTTQNGAWMMHEYSLLPNDIVGTPTATVVCRLRKKKPKRKRGLDNEEEGDDDMAKNRKRSKADQLAISTTAVSVSVNPPHSLLPYHGNDAFNPLELEQVAAPNDNNDEHLLLDRADDPLCEPEDQLQCYNMLLNDYAYSINVDGMLSTKPSNSDGESINNALRQHQTVGIGEEMGLDEDDIQSVIQEFLCEEAPSLLQQNSIHSFNNQFEDF